MAQPFQPNPLQKPTEGNEENEGPQEAREHCLCLLRSLSVLPSMGIQGLDMPAKSWTL
jgi:hypothetical protein